MRKNHLGLSAGGDYTVAAGYRDPWGRQAYLRRGSSTWGYLHIGGKHSLWNVRVIRDTVRFPDTWDGRAQPTWVYRRRYSRLECVRFRCREVSSVWVREVVNYSRGGKGVITAYCEGMVVCWNWLDEY